MKHENQNFPELGKTGPAEFMEQTMRVMDPMRPMVCESLARFWDHQGRLLESMGAFTSGWYARRHSLAAAARDVAQKSRDLESPTDFAREWQAWMSSSFQRMVEDWMTGYQHAVAIMQPPGSTGQGTNGAMGFAPGERRGAQETMTTPHAA